MLFGRLPIFVDIGDVPSGDPMPGEHTFKSTARSANELLARLRYIRDLSEQERRGIPNQARAYSGFYLSEVTPDVMDMICREILLQS